MSEDVKYNLLRYADNAWLIFKYKVTNEIKKQLNEISEKICDWFVDNKLSI